MKSEPPAFENLTEGEAYSLPKDTVFQPKHDGWFCALEVVNGIGCFWARNGKLLKTHPVAAPDCVIYGELMVGTERAQDLNCAGMFYAFDMELPAETYAVRYRRTAELMKGLPTIEMTRCYTDFDALYASFVDKHGGEGIIARDPAAIENKAWKIKVEQTDDLIVREMARGAKGKRILIFDTCKVAVSEKVFAVAMPGRCVEILHFGKTLSGSYRSPRFNRWRDDKSAA